MTEILLLRLVHILGGSFWVGTALFNGLFLVPALTGAGPAMGTVMAGLRERRLFTVLPIVGSLTILSGLRLLWIVSGGFAPGYFGTGPGVGYAVSGSAAVAAFVLAMVVSRPTAAKLMAIGGAMRNAGEAEVARLSAERDRLQRRSAAAGTGSMVLLAFSAAGMAVARYLG